MAQEGSMHVGATCMPARAGGTAWTCPELEVVDVEALDVEASIKNSYGHKQLWP